VASGTSNPNGEVIFSHRYSCLKCPFCQNDLTRPDGVEIETYEEGNGNQYFKSRLDESGLLEDVFDVVADGLHSDTHCSVCDKALNEYEVF
jgi:hypothetical protein